MRNGSRRIGLRRFSAPRPSPGPFQVDEAEAAGVVLARRMGFGPDDVADVVTFAVTRPHHVNIDLMVIKPRAQAAAHKVHRE